MNYLELVKRTAQEAGYGSSIATAQNQSSMPAKFATWVVDAWRDIQIKRNDWLFMSASASVTLVAGENEFSISDDFGITNMKSWVGNVVYASDADGQYQIQLIDYRKFRTLTQGRDITTRRPYYCAIAPGYRMLFDALPEKVATLTGDYLTTAQKLVNDDDEPNMNEDWHMSIVWAALRKYGESEEAQEVVMRAKREFNGIYARMIAIETPPIEFGVDPLATGRSWNDQ